MDWFTLSDLVNILVALGGWEAVRWLLNRKSNNRIAIAQAEREEANADKDEFAVLRETIEFLSKQLHDKEVRFAEQTDVVRRLNEDVMKLTQETGQLKLQLALKRCEVKKCPSREPQNGY